MHVALETQNVHLAFDSKCWKFHPVGRSLHACARCLVVACLDGALEVSPLPLFSLPSRQISSSFLCRADSAGRCSRRPRAQVGVISGLFSLSSLAAKRKLCPEGAGVDNRGMDGACGGSRGAPHHAVCPSLLPRARGSPSNIIGALVL